MVYTAAMNGYEQFIALALATVLAIFLLLGIVVLIIAIKVLRHIRHIAQKAESIADKADAVGDFVRTASGPILLAKFVANMREVVMKRSDKKEKRHG